MNRLDTSREAEELQIEIFRKMGPEKRLRMGMDLARTARKLLERGVRFRHPHYRENQIRLAVIRLTLGEELFLKAYPDAKDIVP